jgi:hypothetical protein
MNFLVGIVCFFVGYLFGVAEGIRWARKKVDEFMEKEN